MSNTQEFNGVTIRGDRRNKTNTGYGVYVGKKRVAWSVSSDEAVRLAIEAVKKERTKGRFVPCVVVFDQAQILNIAVVTDDANGITISRPNYGKPEHPENETGFNRTWVIVEKSRAGYACFNEIEGWHFTMLKEAAAKFDNEAQADAAIRDHYRNDKNCVPRLVPVN